VSKPNKYDAHGRRVNGQGPVKIVRPTDTREVERIAHAAEAAMLALDPPAEVVDVTFALTYLAAAAARRIDVPEQEFVELARRSWAFAAPPPTAPVLVPEG